MYKICYYFLLFLMYSVLGWLTEVVNSYFIHKRFVNRGFLIGPYCPIYGIGVLLIISFLKDYMDNFLVLFILAMVICLILEYLTSYFLELIFKARWWDYSNNRFNINGRVCLETAIPFGIGGLIIMYFINPLFTGILGKMSEKFLIILSVVLMSLFLSDLIISFLIMLKFRSIGIKSMKDNTEEMNKIVKEYLIKNSRWTKRLVDSFPNFKIRIEKIKQKYEIYKNS